MKKIALIGATGSIGRQVISVVANHPDEYKIVAMCAQSRSKALAEAAEVCGAEYFAAEDDRAGALSVATRADADVIFNAAGGFAGLEYSFAAAKAGKTVALANKETLVCGGELIVPLIKKGALIPVDSEHSAVWQCLGFDFEKPFSRLIITASGGPFRGYSKEKLERVTPAQALNHPTWKMGAKITVDSATLLNKGYEVIEAHHLFGAPYERIHTVVQPQSVIHSLVEFPDGALIAQLSRPTMEIPIQLALSFPERLETVVEKMDFTKAFDINFLPLERGEYPLYSLALECGCSGGTLPCALNAASEVAVRAFLDGKIPFTAIYSVAYGVISRTVREDVQSLEQLTETDARARALAVQIIG